MKHLGEYIKNHVEAKGLKKKGVALEVGIAPTYLSTLFREESMDCKLFARICEVIGLSPIGAFEPVDFVTTNSSNTGVASTMTNNAEQIKLLRELLAEKERTIQFLLEVARNRTGSESGQLQ